MARARHKLAATKVAKLTRPGRYGDGGGLYVQITKAGSRSWLYRYMLAGRSREMGLGPVVDVSLAQARERAAEARSLVRAGRDPIETRAADRAARKLEQARGVTFQQCAKRFIEAHAPGWRNEKHGNQWSATLEFYAYPTFGALPVAAIDTALVLQALEPVWAEKPETANRVRGRIERILDWARARELRAGENPARWRGHLDKLLPAPRRMRGVRHHPAMPWAQLPAFMTQLRAADSVSARALEFTILTAARTAETIHATWDEIGDKAKVWTIPGARTKSGRPHRVPLSNRALAILEGLPRERANPFLFIGGRKGAGLSNMAMLQLLRGMTDEGLTVHGFRSTFRDWAGERTAHPREVAEAALGHVVGDRTEAAYRRGDALEKRRRLMRDWAAYCESAPAQSGDNVIAMRER